MTTPGSRFEGIIGTGEPANRGVLRTKPRILTGFTCRPSATTSGSRSWGWTPGREPGTQQSQHRVLGSGYTQEVDLLTLVKDVAAQFAQQVSSPEQSNKLAVGCGRPGGELLNKQ